MLRNITPAQKRAGGFHNQLKHGCFFFLHGTENKKIFSQDLKLETKVPGTFLKFYFVL